MLKKLTVLALCTIMLFALNYTNNVPTFSGYATEFEVYVGEASSSAQILSLDANSYPLVKDISGEAVKIDLEEFSLEQFLSDFSAKIVFSEQISEGISYYAFSPKIKYRKKVCGEIVNLQIFVGNSVTVGTPIICGSF